MNLPARVLIAAILVCWHVTYTQDSSQTNQLIAPRLIQPLEFASFTVSDIHSQQGASNLMSLKIKVGSEASDAYEFMTTKGDAPRIRVETVNEYKAAIKAGYSPCNTFEVTMESWFKTACATLNFMAQAQPSRHSYLDKRFLERLPVTVLNWNGAEGDELKQDAAKGMTLKDRTAAKAQRHIHKLKVAGNTMTFSDAGCDYSVSELARGDFDSDGNEDALITVALYHQGGSGRGYAMYVVTSTDGNQRQLKLIDLGAAK
jgi:hypothetical protein